MKVLDLPRRPDAFAPHQINDTPIILTQSRLPVILNELENGKRDPLDHACLPQNEWLEIKRIFLDVAAYMRQAEAYFDDIEKQQKELLELKAEMAKNNIEK